MSTQHMDERFSVALRAALVEHVSAAPRRRRLPGRKPMATGAFVAVALAGGGVALATQNQPVPGAPVVTSLGATRTVTRTGTATVDLGAPPAGANSIQIALTCLTEGRFFTPDGAGLVCRPPNIGEGVPAVWTQPLTAGHHTITIDTAAGSRWSLSATYSAVYPSPWGRNAAGQTFGVANAHGEPDLIAIVATNGETGYAFSSQVGPNAWPQPTNPTQAIEWQNTPLVAVHVPVYLADGKTRIGQFDEQVHEAYLHAKANQHPRDPTPQVPASK